MAANNANEYVTVREMVPDDLLRGFLECLSALRPTALSLEEAATIYDQRKTNPCFYTLVAIAVHGPNKGKVVGTASVWFEQKYINRGGVVCHVEDVSVLREVQKKKVGKTLMSFVIGFAMKAGAYKMILDCEQDIVSFYEKFGFKQDGQHLRLNLTTDSCPFLN